MSIVDDYGRYEADLDLIRARCFPLQLDRWPVKRIAQYLREISASPLIESDSPLPTVENGETLVTVYLSGNKLYLQINKFDQRIQSKARYPEPPTAIAPASKRKPQVNGTNGNHSDPNWMIDESFAPFAELCRQFWPRILDEEITQGHSWFWKKLSIEQRILATKNLRSRVDAGEDGEYVKHMPDYLRAEWKRGPKAKPKIPQKQHLPSDTEYRGD
jgi:hypothetical protein